MAQKGKDEAGKIRNSQVTTSCTLRLQTFKNKEKYLKVGNKSSNGDKGEGKKGEKRIGAPRWLSVVNPQPLAQVTIPQSQDRARMGLLAHQRVYFSLCPSPSLCSISPK